MNINVEYKGPTNGAKVVRHTDGNRLLNQIAAGDLAHRQAQAHAQRVAHRIADAASAPEDEPVESETGAAE
ncbi:hypothetical protein [Burkholderia sp. WSM2230]|uniref:hypothetical protein n=1 Tax=Burkholderia sp. WSM2230 TaxID=944435 RepID=UPI0004075AAA|nr:hypothetical protein [Burkholderia sp. WSM2230]